MSNCRSCGEKIKWVESPNGKHIPYNLNGICHFETCPQAPKWRKRENQSIGRRAGKYSDTSHDYTKPKKLKDKQQTRLK